MDIHSYSSKEQQAEQLAHRVSTQLDGVLAQKKSATLAVPGGTTPAPFMRSLAKQAIDWQRVRVTLTDERQVPITDDASNQKQLLACLDVFDQGAVCIPLYTEGESLSTRRMQIQTILPLDVCVLGMGADGHIASLFLDMYGKDAAFEREGSDMLIEVTTPSSEYTRISFTLSALADARQIHFLISGSTKRAQIETALNNIADSRWEEALPVQHLLYYGQDKTQIHYTD